MSKLVGVTNGVVVHRTLMCHNPHCAGIIQTAKGPAPVRFAQKQYSHIAPPPCMYCGMPFVIESNHAKKDGHTRRADEHKVRDLATEQVFQHAQDTQHKLVENAREGDTAKLVMDGSAAAYLKETEEMAKAKGMHTGFANSKFAGHRKMVSGVAADSTFARQTVADGAMLPVNALAASTGNAGFAVAQGPGTFGIRTGGGHQFWRQPSSSRKIR